VAINDVLRLKAAQRNAIARVYGSPKHKRPNFDGFIHTYYAAPLISFRLAKFGWVPFADLRVRCLVTKQNAEFMQGG